MSTRAYLGMLMPNGNVQYIYLHNDGYPSGAGRILNTFYTDADKVAELIKLGDVSGLGGVIGEKHGFNDRNYDDPDAKRPCTFYGRDRGETGTGANTTATERGFLNAAKSNVAYRYLFKDGQWYGARASAKNIIPVSDMLANPNVE